MTREQILEWCRLAPAVGAVKHEEFADYVVALQQRKKIDDEWTTVETPYMAVDGKLAMANEDHRRQAKRLDFGPPQVLVDNGEQLTLLVTVTSEIYGTRHGIATSRRSGGTGAEREFPWEVAETSAIGRALSAMGYGLFPGSGLASAEDMLRVGDRRDSGREERHEPARSPAGNGNGSNRTAREEAERQPSATPQQPVRPRSPVSAVQRRKLIELYVKQHGGGEADATRALDRLFVEAFKHGLSEASYEEGGHIMAGLLAAQKAR
jgi:hypothetical protein